jgi:hypothetical protein
MFALRCSRGDAIKGVSMDRSLEAKAWRRGFAAGFLAFGLSVAGQMAASRTAADAPPCPLQAQPGVAEQLIERLKPAVRSHGIAQRVALAVLGAMLHGSCS